SLGLLVFTLAHFIELKYIRDILGVKLYSFLLSFAVIVGAVTLHVLLELLSDDLNDHFPQHHIKRFLDFPLIGWCLGFSFTQWYVLAMVLG
ncbi:MAG: hypothetical protein ACLGGX_12710, partial [Bdellovibrionia bacterium]